MGNFEMLMNLSYDVSTREIKASCLSGYEIAPFPRKGSSWHFLSWTMPKEFTEWWEGTRWPPHNLPSTLRVSFSWLLAMSLQIRWHKIRWWSNTDISLNLYYSNTSGKKKYRLVLSGKTFETLVLSKLVTTARSAHVSVFSINWCTTDILSTYIFLRILNNV